MRQLNFTYKAIEKVLTTLHYSNIEYLSSDAENNMVWYEATIDTEYRIQVIFYGTNSMEIWDCDYYEDNYVRAGRAVFENGKWDISEG